MASKEFKQTVKAVGKNFQKYTEAMESDIQLLIASMLDVIEGKINALRKLLKLKLCIKNVKNIASLNINHITDTSANTTLVTVEEKEPDKKGSDSLSDLSSAIYEIDKNSLPLEENEILDDESQKMLQYIEDINRLGSLCSIINRHRQNVSHLKDDGNGVPRTSLEKYIYLVLDSEKSKEKLKQSEKTKDNKTTRIGDCKTENDNVEGDSLKVNQSHASGILLGLSEYESILDILNMVLKSYKIQEKLSKKNTVVEKAKTVPLIGTTELEMDAGRKSASEGTCQEKDGTNVEKKLKYKKNNCFL